MTSEPDWHPLRGEDPHPYGIPPNPYRKRTLRVVAGLVVRAVIVAGVTAGLIGLVYVWLLLYVGG